MPIELLKRVFSENEYKDAIIYRDEIYNYKWLLGRIEYWKKTLKLREVRKGTVVALEADFSPNSVALLLALIDFRFIIVPFYRSAKAKKSYFMKTAQCEIIYSIDTNDQVKAEKLGNSSEHKFYQRLRQKRHAGLILFSSGSTGKPKAAVHDLTTLIQKYKIRRHSYRTIAFLMFDHIGGFNTLFYTLSNAGCIITVQDRSPDAILKNIEKYSVDLLPTTPTFINLILLSEAYKRHDINCLKLVTYGTEPIAESALKRFNNLYPMIKLVQTYGLSEIGILQSKSKSSDSLWVKVGGVGFETRVVDGILQIKARSAMIGYLNAPCPFTKDGWFITGDSVKINGEYIWILGRESEIINVGGEKVYPAEVESIIQQVDGVAEVTVYGKKNPILGNIVCAKIRLKVLQDSKLFKKKLKKYCYERLEKYKVPVKINISEEKQHSDRFKKNRSFPKPDKMENI